MATDTHKHMKEVAKQYIQQFKTHEPQYYAYERISLSWAAYNKKAAADISATAHFCKI